MTEPTVDAGDDVDDGWDDAVIERLRTEHVFPLPLIERRQATMTHDDFGVLWAELERVMPTLTARQLMFLHSTVGWERDLRNARDRANRLTAETRAGGWEGWSELRRRDHLEFRWSASIDASDIGVPHAGGLLRGGSGPREGVRVWLSWSSSNRRTQKRLAHELTHDDRGIVPRGTDDETRELEERVVDRIAYERLASYMNRTPAPTLDRVRGLPAVLAKVLPFRRPRRGRSGPPEEVRVSVRELAARMGVSESTVRRRIKEGTTTTVKRVDPDR